MTRSQAYFGECAILARAAGSYSLALRFEELAATGRVPEWRGVQHTAVGDGALALDQALDSLTRLHVGLASVEVTP